MPLLSGLPSRLLGNRGAAIPAANLLLWLKADAIAGKSNADAITAWADSSINGYSVNAGTNATYRTNVQNTKPVVRTAAGYMTIDSSTALLNALHYAGATVYLALSVGATANPNALYGLIGNNSAGTGRGMCVYWDDRAGSSRNNRLACIIGNGGGQICSNISNDNAFSPQTFGVISNVLDPQNATVGNRSAIRVNNGTAIAANASTGAANSGNAAYDLQIGATGNNNYTSYADFGEIIIYGAKHDDTTRQAIERYLGTKWGVTIS